MNPTLLRPVLRAVLTALAALAAAGSTLAAPAGGDTATLPDLSLEDLLQTDVVTASRKSQALQGVAAAVFVISRDDIERSGASSLPELLRLAPGVQVARLSSGRWAVSARGFNGRFANKLLVLMDGRSIYSPLFSGVLWELEGTLLEDIERIEVIRGPGAALWGANAVNGVINILTRKTSQTQGTLLALGAGSIERGSAALRRGGSLPAAGPSGHWRLWAKTESQRRFDADDHSAGHDAWYTSRVGLRSDLALASGDSLSLSGSLVHSHNQDRWRLPDLTSASGWRAADKLQISSGGHLLANWQHLGADGSETIVRGYLERSRVQVDSSIDERRSSFDIDLQHRPRLGGAHDVIWGLTYRRSNDRIGSAGAILLTPERRQATLASVFFNDEITLLPERLLATLGARLEHNNATGTEPQPQLRLAWTPNRQQTLWTALSRAVRTPSRAERDAELDLAVTPASGALPAVLLRNLTAPDHRLLAETVHALEIGARHAFEAGLAIDLAGFYNRYAQLRSASLGTLVPQATPLPHLVQNINPDNRLAGHTHGLELTLDWRASRNWRVQAGWSSLHAHIRSDSSDPMQQAAAATLSGSAPRQQGLLRASLTLGRGVELDARLRHVASLQKNNPQAPTIPAYTALDLRCAWHPAPGMLLALSGENLLQRRHTEATPELLPSQPLQVPRSLQAKLQWAY